MQIQAALLRSTALPLSIESLELDDPKGDEVLVRIVATGICHTDIAVMHGRIPFPAAPCVLGHEGSGIVERVGPQASGLAVGDPVALSFAACGACARCKAGEPAYCEQFFAVNFLGKRADGSCTHHQGEAHVHGNFFGQSSFGSHVLVRARNAVKLPADVPLELMGPLGCGMQTGAGAVFNVLKPAPGSSIAVFGAGAVGDAAIMAAKEAGCTTIIAIDINDARLALARELGATHALNGRTDDLLAAIKKIAPAGVNFAVDATGIDALATLSVKALAHRGRSVLLGVYNPSGRLDIAVNDLAYGRSVSMSTEGDGDPQVLVPRLVALYRAGRFPFDKLVRFYDFADINQAVKDAESGEAIKPVVRMP